MPMIASKNELFAVLRQYNPWWGGTKDPGLPSWRRAVFPDLLGWLTDPPAPRAVQLSGARQVGKTTLILQAIEALLGKGVRPEQILYVTFDHPLMKLLGLEKVFDLWRELQPPPEGVEYLLLDEIQNTNDWQVWLKHQVDFQKGRRIAVTGSAIPLNTDQQESGVGRWHTIKLPTLSFFEYLQIKKIEPPTLPKVTSLKDIFEWSQADRVRVGETARPLVAHFHEYLVRGGFPQTALVEDITRAQELLREDIVDKVLKRDMTALFGVRLVLELEKTFLYLCLHDGGILDLPQLCNSLDLKKPTVNKFLSLLEAAHLIYKLPPYGHGKKILRARYKIYLADAAIAGSVLLKGRGLIEDRTRLGAAVETAFFKHVFSHYYRRISVGFSYWHGKGGHEVDIVAEVQDKLIPFEVKYSGLPVKIKDLKGLRTLCTEKRVARAYVVTRELSDFDVDTMVASPKSSAKTAWETTVLKIPAPLACFWLGQMEHHNFPNQPT